MKNDDKKPDKLTPEQRFDSFGNGEALCEKKTGRLPAMGWNSWNAFGSGNTQELTKAMADRMVELGLRDLGYEYVVLDDGCYKPERTDGRLSNDEDKFPEGFKALGDYIHDRGLKFGMYNDIGTNLCAGAEVGTFDHEEEDAASYSEWGVDFIKVDNCYYMWDNATFSCPANARYSYAPNIRTVKIGDKDIPATKGCITGKRACLSEDGSYVTFIGTFDGTGPDASPVGDESSELIFELTADGDKQEDIRIEYATGKEEGAGAWLQLYVDDRQYYDDLLEETADKETFAWSGAIRVQLHKGKNTLRLMNHRRQENTLNSYTRFKRALCKTENGSDILLSACEWGKTQPQNWAYKVCDSWRILNDITFHVGRDGDPGRCGWTDDYTCSITSQYNKAVIMDEYAGLSKGWNDPDMMVIGMDGLNITQNRTHMVMWCMMNSPLMLGIDLRRVEKGDEYYNIIADKELIAINQDPLGIQAKRVYSTKAVSKPDKEYIRDNDRVDILAKPLSGNRFAVSFINIGSADRNEKYSIKVCDIKKYLGDWIFRADAYRVKDITTGKEEMNTTGIFEVSHLKAYDSVTFIVSPVVSGEDRYGK